jgi:hypothetical protein
VFPSFPVMAPTALAATQKLDADPRRTALSTPVTVPGPSPEGLRSHDNLTRRRSSARGRCRGERPGVQRHRGERHNIILWLWWGTLMRHDLLLCTIAAGACCMMHAPATARLIAPAGRPLSMLARFLCTGAGAINLAVVAVAADQHLSPAAHAQKKPRCCCVRPARCRMWTRSATSGIIPGHACFAPCGGTAPNETWPLRSAPCLSAQPDRSSRRQVCTRRAAKRATACEYVDNARALPTSPQAQPHKQQPASI